MDSLYDRIIAATGPDEKLDAEIEAAFCTALTGDQYHAEFWEGNWHAVTEGRKSMVWPEPRTASVDAALGLVGDGWLCGCGELRYYRDDETEFGEECRIQAWAALQKDVEIVRFDEIVDVHHVATRPLAICAAVCKQRGW